MSGDIDPLFDPGWPESERLRPPVQAQGGWGFLPAPGSTDEQIGALVRTAGHTQDEARSYARGWRQVK